MKKATVEIHDEQVVAFLQECIDSCCMASVHGVEDGLKEYIIQNIAEYIEICNALNRTIRFLGGREVEVVPLLHKHIMERRAQTKTAMDNGVKAAEDVLEEDWTFR